MDWLRGCIVVVCALALTSLRRAAAQQNGSAFTVVPADIAAVGPADDPAALQVIGLYSPIREFWVLVAGFGVSDLTGNSRARTPS